MVAVYISGAPAVGVVLVHGTQLMGHVDASTTRANV
jgi:hypothetical protein